jgi:predicted DNA-binding transcriptional regulator AlpA
MNQKTANVQDMSGSDGFGSSVEIIDAPELARRLQVPVSWVRQRATSPRFNKEQRIPHVRLGKYVRFAWASDELKAWLHRCLEQ